MHSKNTIIDGVEYPLIELTQGHDAIVDPEDFERLSKVNWYYRGSDGYACRNVSIKGQAYTSPNLKWKKTKQKTCLMHREVVDLQDEKIIVDHISGNRLDNRKCNLRIITKREKIVSRSKRTNSNNTSGRTGVTVNKKTGKYVARITHKGIIYTLGTFTSLDDASEVYTSAKAKYTTNFVFEI